MASQYQPGDSLREVRERARVHRQDCPTKSGDCGDPYDLVPLPPRYIIKRGGVDLPDVSAADYADSILHYRRTRDATFTSPEAVENIARWATMLTDVQLEAAFAQVYGDVPTNRAMFNALRSRVRTARG